MILRIGAEMRRDVQDVHFAAGVSARTPTLEAAAAHYVMALARRSGGDGWRLLIAASQKSK